MTDRRIEPDPLRLAFLVLGPFAAGYFLSYLYRAVNAVVAPDLVRDVGLTASQLGLMTAAYLFAFAGFQLPLGILLDRFGPRRVQAAMLCVSASGSLLFALAPDAVLLTVARALIGLGFAGGLMSGFQAVALWVAETRRAFANACVMAFGGLGVLAATKPADLATQAFGWRAMFLALAAVTVAVAALIFFVVPERERSAAAPAASLREQTAAVGRILCDPVFWRVAPLVAATAGVNVGIQTLWAGPWLRDVAGLDRDGVASILALTATGFLVGTLLSGAIADALRRRGVSLLTTMLACILLFLAAEAAIVLQWTAMTPVMWTLFGMVGQAGILAYPWLASHFGLALAGRSNTALNLMVFATAFASQYAIGAIIDLWPATAGGGYHPQAYAIAFGAFLALQLAALLWYVAARPEKAATRSLPIER